MSAWCVLHFSALPRALPCSSQSTTNSAAAPLGSAVTGGHQVGEGEQLGNGARMQSGGVEVLEGVGALAIGFGLAPAARPPDRSTSSRAWTISASESGPLEA